MEPNRFSGTSVDRRIKQTSMGVGNVNKRAQTNHHFFVIQTQSSAPWVLLYKLFS